MIVFLLSLLLDDLADLQAFLLFYGFSGAGFFSSVEHTRIRIRLLSYGISCAVSGALYDFNCYLHWRSEKLAGS